MCIVLTHTENSINDEYYHYYLYYRCFVFEPVQYFCKIGRFSPNSEYAISQYSIYLLEYLP